MGECDPTEELCENLLAEHAKHYFSEAQRVGYDAEAVIPRASAYLTRCHIKRQEGLMKDMHKQSQTMTRLTVAVMVMTGAIVVLTVAAVCIAWVGLRS